MNPNTTPQAAEAARLADEIERLALRHGQASFHGQGPGGGAEWRTLVAAIGRLRDLASRADSPVGEAVERESAENILNSWLDNQHPDDVAVDAFASKMRQKMAAARTKGRGGWDDKAQCSAETLSRMLREHVEKGDPVDVANFAMMLSQRGERIATAPAASASVQGVMGAEVPEKEIDALVNESREKEWTTIQFVREAVRRFATPAAPSQGAGTGEKR